MPSMYMGELEISVSFHLIPLDPRYYHFVDKLKWSSANLLFPIFSGNADAFMLLLFFLVRPLLFTFTLGGR